MASVKSQDQHLRKKSRLSASVKFPDSDVLAVVCGDNLLHPYSQARNGRSTASENAVNGGIF